MTVSVIAMDYSRPIQPLFELPLRAGIVGRVHSVFHRAINIAFDDTIPAYLTLLSAELPRMPNSVRLSAVGGAINRVPTLGGSAMNRTSTDVVNCPFASGGAMNRVPTPGVDVLIGDGRLLIPACDFSLSLPEAPPWEPRPDMTMCHWCRETVAQHVQLLARYLSNQPQQGGLIPLIGPLLLGQPTQETPLARMALPMLRMLARASWQQHMAGVEEATRRLAGLGPGLTPAGDDALGGFAAVMVLLSSQLSADAVSRDSIAASIAAVARLHTTMLSAVLLVHAARGEVAESVGQLLLALARPTEQGEAVLRIADRVLTFGATSGGDTLLGILLGLRVLEGGID